ncbi:MAG TPA: S8 family serine peptidase, partial [Planctomycetota bacterium]|nr:S8 family serine peptidase [Planctomycetota bacterium]
MKYTISTAHPSLLALLVAWIPAAQAQDPSVNRPEGESLFHHLSQTASDVRVVSVPNSPAWAITWSEQGANGAPEPYFSLSLDGDTFTDPKANDARVLLRFAEFDPLEALPAVPTTLHRPSGSSLHIVQFRTQGIEPYRETLRSMGVRLHLFLANHSHVVGMNAKQAEQVRSLPFVRWVGPFHVAYKFERGLLSADHPVWDESPTARFNMLTMERGMEGQEPVSQFIATIGGTVNQTTPETFLMSATLTRDQLLEVARLDHVQWIDVWGEPEHDMDIARQMHGSDYVQSVGGYLGQGVQVEVLDGGCDKNHPDLKKYKEHGPNSPGSHGTSTSGIVCGSGGMELRGGIVTIDRSGNWAARGVMPLARLVVADYANVSNRYKHTQDLQAKPYRCVLQTNSWGDPRTKNYTSVSQQMDLILFDFSRISILQSQSNAGDQMSRPQAWAKNIIAVGGVYHQDSLTKNDDSWSGGGSIGPAADGRIKPDLASYYDNILTTTIGGGYTSSFGGTSGATPIIAGHL